jgi:hypothetical protein
MSRYWPGTHGQVALTKNDEDPNGMKLIESHVFYRQLEGFMPSAAFWPLDRNGSSPTPSYAGPSLLAATPTMLSGTQRIDTAVYWGLT